jgi:uncharacterized protein (UPF0548 family)
MFRQPGVRLVAPEGEPAVGAVVAIVARLGPWSWSNACRVVELINESGPPRRFGFAYGTLPDHAVRGEERFCVERDADGVVWYDLLAYSRPGHWLFWLGYPVARLVQRRFARRSAVAMARAVAPTS